MLIMICRNFFLKLITLICVFRNFNTSLNYPAECLNIQLRSHLSISQSVDKLISLNDTEELLYETIIVEDKSLRLKKNSSPVK